MIKAQLKSNFSPTFLLNFFKTTDVEERESLKLERESEILYSYHYSGTQYSPLSLMEKKKW
jgi:hypothetical protein